MDIQRKYRMTRIKTGDYLLPSNDTKTMWRLVAYEEDGSAETWDGRKLTGTFWVLWRWEGLWTVDALADSLELGDWSRWEYWGGPFSTRREAIEQALTH